jgi:flagellar motor switch protein FliN/FliY
MARSARGDSGVSEPGKEPAERESAEIVVRLLDDWARTLVQVLEAMTGQKPAFEWRKDLAAPAGSGMGEELLWWEQPFQISPAAKAWVGAPRAVWEHIATLALKAAGFDTAGSSEARNTWYEILGQSLSGMAASIGAHVGREVNCEAGVERAPGPEGRHRAWLCLSFTGSPLEPLVVALSAKLVNLISSPAEIAAEDSGAGPGAVLPKPGAEADSPPARSRTLDLLLDVELPVSISFGKAELPMKEILKLTTGSIVELNRAVNDPVEVLVNHSLIARGEVVVVDGNYGVRIQQIVNRQDRLRSLR